VIQYLPREVLRHPALLESLYRDFEHDLYWSDCWDPDFYVELARRGFITVAVHHPELGELMIPEMQEAYAVLDWERLHRSRSLRRWLRTPGADALGLELRVAPDCVRVLERLLDYHGADCWLGPAYRALMRALPFEPEGGFALHGIELWSTRREELVAGELGYTIGRTYTSLSGFCRRDGPEQRHLGTLQIVRLAERLRDAGYAFWNLGQPMAYKRALGARFVPRLDFLARYLAEVDRLPRAPLRGGRRA